MFNDKEKALVKREGPSQNIVKYRGVLWTPN